MKPRVVLSLVALAVALAILATTSRSLGMARGVSARQRADIAREIEAQLRETYDLTKPDVADRLLSLYPDSGRVVSATAGQVVTSRDSLADGIRYFWNAIGRNMREPTWIWERIVIDVLAPDAAAMTAVYRVPHRTPDGNPHEIGGAWTAALVKRGAKWVIVQEHLSDAPVAESQPAPDEQPAAPVDTSLLRRP